jgi:hypothetical protein
MSPKSPKQDLDFLTVTWSSLLQTTPHESTKKASDSSKSQVHRIFEQSTKGSKWLGDGWVSICVRPCVGVSSFPEMLQQGCLWVAGGSSHLSYHSPCQSSSAPSGAITECPIKWRQSRNPQSSGAVMEPPISSQRQR